MYRMRTAVISDIHGEYGALAAVLADIDAAGCDRIICLGDVVNGGEANGACIRELTSRHVITIRGNHDELFVHTHSGMEADWLRSLPESLTEGDVLFIHISPRRDDRAIRDRFIAWNVLDDTRQRIAFIGHVHAPGVYGMNGATVGAARNHTIEYGRAMSLGTADRYLICPGSVGFPRDGDDASRYAIYDDRAGSVEFRRIGASSNSATIDPTWRPPPAST